MVATNSTLHHAFVDPGSCQPQRLPAFPNVEQSAVINLRQDFSTSGVIPDGVTVGQRMLLLRQPAYPLLMDQYAVSAWMWGTNVPISTNATAAETQLTWQGEPARDYGYTTDNNLISVVPSGSFTPTYRVRASGTTVNGCAVLGVLSGEERPYVWIPPNGGLATGTITIACVMSTMSGTLSSFDASTNGGYVQINADFVDAPGKSTSGVMHTFSGVFSQVASNSQCIFLGTSATIGAGWFRVNSISVKGIFPANDSPPEFCDVWIGYAGSAPTVATNATNLVVVNPNNNAALLPAFRPIETSTTLAHLLGSRCTALSLSATNVSQVMTKEGIVQAGRLPMNKSLWAFTKQSIGSLPPMKRFQGPLEVGFYAVAPPISDLDNWLDFAWFSNSHGTIPVFNLDSSAEAVAISLADPTLVSAFSLALKLCMHLEFKCYSQLWPTTMSRRTIEELHRAVVDAVTGGFCFSRTEYGRARVVQQGVIATRPAAPKRERKTRRRGPMQRPITKAEHDRQQRRKEKRRQARSQKRAK